MTQKSPKPNFLASNFSAGGGITHWLSTLWKTHFCQFFILLIIRQLQARQNTNAEIRVKHWYSAPYKHWLKIMDTHIGNTGLLIKILTYVLRVLKKHLHGNTCNHPERSEGSPHRQHWLKKIVAMVSVHPPFQRSLKICITPFLFAYNTILAPLNFCIECRRYRAKRSCDTEDSSRATDSVSQQGLYDRYGAICKKKRSKSFDLLLWRGGYLLSHLNRQYHRREWA